MKGPLTRSAAAIRPSSVREKYSGDWNCRANMASAGAKVDTMMMATQPPKNDERVVNTRAGPARPCLAIGWPSIAVTAEAAVPGRLRRMETVEPPYIDP